MEPHTRVKLWEDHVRRRNVAALMGAAGVALGVAVAAPAHADDAQFLADMHALGWGNDNGDAGHLYKNLCLGSAETLPSTGPSGIVNNMRSTKTVQDMWDEVWNAHDPDAVDRFVTDDVVVVIGGKEISGKDDFKDSIRELLDNVEDLHLDAIETFQNEDGTRVTSRWVLTGSNNGFLGTQPNHKPIAMTGTAIWEVREDGKLTRNTVEQASFELYHFLLEK
jgi:steroid delta-isomerase-like uncharacterized protein